MNPTTNRVYATSQWVNTVFIVDSSNTVVATVAAGVSGLYSNLGVAVNPTTNAVYVVNQQSNSVVVLDGPPPPPPPPPFSQPFNPPTGACICTPLLMNTNVQGTQNWWVRASGGPLTITAIAHAVNNVNSETVNAKVYDSNNNILADMTTGYPANPQQGWETSVAFTVNNAPQYAIYRVSVTTPNASPQQPHYRLKFNGADAAGTTSPSSPSFEHQGSIWYFNLGANEPFHVRVFVNGTPSSTSTLSYALIDPTGSTHPGNVTATTSADGFIGFPAITTAGTWALRVDSATDHYGLDKTGGNDRGIYLSWKSAGEGDIRLTAVTSVSGGPLFTGLVTFTLRDASGTVLRTQTTSTGSMNFNKMPPGEYIVDVTGPQGWTVAPQSVHLFVFCDMVTPAEFVLTPPPPPDTTITSGPPAISNTNSAQFTFTSNPAGATFQCKVDGGSFNPCGSPYSIGGLADGPHTFQVRAINTAGVTDPTPATWSWTIILNRPPTANAGPDQSVDENTAVNLNGTGSSDPDGDTLSFSWIQTGGPVVTLTGGNTAAPSFTAPNVAPAGATLTFELKVIDGLGLISTDTVAITVKNVNRPPTANAGPDQSVDENAAVNLNGTGSDPDGDTLSFSWIQTGGPVVTLTGGNTAAPSFTAPSVSPAGDTLTFELKVSDGLGLTSTDTVVITVNNVNQAPDANDDVYSMSQGTTLTVSAPGVLGNDTDIDGNLLTATVVTGPAVGTLTLNSNGSFSYTPPALFSGTVNFTYGVSDGAASDIATVVITVNPIEDRRMTGGGSVFTAAKGERVTHGMVLHCNAAATPQNLEINWGKGNNFHLTSVSSVQCTDDPTILPTPPAAGFDTITGVGTGRLNNVDGATVSFTFTDAGEPGKDDMATIVIKDSSGATVQTLSGKLNVGNHQAHK